MLHVYTPFYLGVLLWPVESVSVIYPQDCLRKFGHIFDLKYMVILEISFY